MLLVSWYHWQYAVDVKIFAVKWFSPVTKVKHMKIKQAVQIAIVT